MPFQMTIQESDQVVASRLLRAAGFEVIAIAGANVTLDGGTQAEANAALTDVATLSAAEVLTRAKAEGNATVMELARRLSGLVTSGYPQAEIDFWPSKDILARAHLDGDPQAVLAEEAAITGEDVDDLAAAVVAKSDPYQSVIAQLTGFRRKAWIDITAAADAAAVAVIVDAAEASAETIKGNIITTLGGGSS